MEGKKCKTAWRGIQDSLQCEPSGKNIVGVIVAPSWTDKVVEVERVDGRMMKVNLLIKNNTLSVISTYAPQTGRPQSETETFLENLECLVQRIGQEERIVIGADMNAHVGEDALGYEDVHGGNGYGERNEEGEKIWEMLESLDLCITNTLFKKRTEHLVTYKSGGRQSQIDYVLLRREDRRAVKDCKVIPGEAAVCQHRLVVADLRWRKENTVRKSEKIKGGGIEKEEKRVCV